MKYHDNENANLYLDAMMKLAIDKMGFNKGSLEANCNRIFYGPLRDSTRKVGKFVYCTEYITHEISHLLIEDRMDAFSAGKTHTQRRNFSGQINELQTVALSTMILEDLYPVAKGFRWSRQRRCLETFVNNVNEKRTWQGIQTTIEYMMPDRQLRLLKQGFMVHLIKNLPKVYYKYLSDFDF
jgi:hypothetical protein